MKLIALYPEGSGLFAKVDDEDFEELNKYKWYRNQTGQQNGDGSDSWYAVRTDGGTITRMHRFLTNAPKGTHVNHNNHDTLDNQKANLEVVSLVQSHQARRRLKKGKWGFKGVRASNKEGTKFHVTIAANHQVYRYGPYSSVEEAARGYDKAARELHGRFAVCNFPE